jgi:general stress protein 26
MSVQGGSAEKTGKLWDMIKSIRFAMLTSEDGEVLRSRPMAASQNDFDGDLWFFTRLDSHKVAEVEQDARVNVSYADPDHQNYVSLSGTARIVRDRTAIDAHWSEGARTWFPRGKDDPAIALLKVSVSQAEYWDAPSSAMVMLFGYAKAVTTGRAPRPGEHATVSFT